MNLSKKKIELSGGEIVYYITILDIKDEREFEIMGKKVEQLLKEQKTRTVVF